MRKIQIWIGPFLVKFTGRIIGSQVDWLIRILYFIFRKSMFVEEINSIMVSWNKCDGDSTLIDLF